MEKPNNKNVEISKKNKIITIVILCLFCIILLPEAFFMISMSGSIIVGLIILLIIISIVFFGKKIIYSLIRKGISISLILGVALIMILAFEYFNQYSISHLIYYKINTNYLKSNLKIYNLNDELLMSKQGNPVGIRLTFDINFPISGNLSLDPVLLPIKGYGGSLRMSSEYTQVTNSNGEPEREVWNNSSSLYHKKGTYTVVMDMLPGFDPNPNKNSVYKDCFNIGSNKTLETLEKEIAGINGSNPYYINFDGPYVPSKLQLHNTYTKNKYDPLVFYQGYLKEGYSHVCGDNDRKRK